MSMSTAIVDHLIGLADDYAYQFSKDRTGNDYNQRKVDAARAKLLKALEEATKK